MPEWSHNTAAGFLQSNWWETDTDREREMDRQKEPKNKAGVFYNLTSEVTYHHFCSILLVTKTNPVTMWEGTTKGCECQEAGITGEPPGSWLPQGSTEMLGDGDRRETFYYIFYIISLLKFKLFKTLEFKRVRGKEHALRDNQQPQDQSLRLPVIEPWFSNWGTGTPGEPYCIPETFKATEQTWLSSL